MRAALTRYAQPHAARSAKVLTLVRRLDATLKPIIKPFEKVAVTCDRQLDVAALDDPPREPYADLRAADLARVQVADAADFLAALGAYEEADGTPLDDGERNAVALLGIALALDALGDVLAEWANQGRANPPVDAVDEACARIEAMLDALGVPEERPPSNNNRRPRNA